MEIKYLYLKIGKDNLETIDYKIINELSRSIRHLTNTNKDGGVYFINRNINNSYYEIEVDVDYWESLTSVMALDKSISRCLVMLIRDYRLKKILK